MYITEEKGRNTFSYIHNTIVFMLFIHDFNILHIIVSKYLFIDAEYIHTIKHKLIIAVWHDSEVQFFS